MRSICNSRFLTAISVVGLVGGAVAQTSTPPQTISNPCPSDTAPVLVSFSVERVLDPTQILSTLTPILPAGIVPGIQNKVLEIHESITFNNQNQMLTLNLFPKQTGASLPTVPGGVISGTVFSILEVKVDKIYTTCTPGTNLMFVGTVAANSPVSPFGNLTGAPAAISVDLTNDNPPMIKNVVVVQAGTSVSYSATGAGTITFAAGPVTPPGTGGGPTVIVKAAPLTTFPVVDLDASASTSQNPPLAFEWTVVAGAADIANAKAAKAIGYILGSAGTYTFRVKVTDSKGNVATKDVTVQYL